ncbi:MAG TPA: hypothetical protein VFT98_12930, partial [Myxococcota bacterium]|nr:hypothetical protein [Myxococcota bacterium]
MTETAWRRCSACKNPIALGAIHQVCSVSTCNRPRTGLVFCSVSCWEVHLPDANHREAWAVERRAPTSVEPGDAAASASGQRRFVRPPQPVARVAANALPNEVLIVASRLKDYVRAKAGYNTSDRVLEPLSDIVRRIADQAIENARRDGRMT